MTLGDDGLPVLRTHIYRGHCCTASGTKRTPATNVGNTSQHVFPCFCDFSFLDECDIVVGTRNRPASNSVLNTLSRLLSAHIGVLCPLPVWIWESLCSGDFMLEAHRFAVGLAVTRRVVCCQTARWFLSRCRELVASVLVIWTSFFVQSLMTLIFHSFF